MMTKAAMSRGHIQLTLDAHVHTHTHTYICVYIFLTTDNALLLKTELLLGSFDDGDDDDDATFCFTDMRLFP